jgi:hypothetical protein
MLRQPWIAVSPRPTSFGGKGKFLDSYATGNELFCVIAVLPTVPASGTLNVAGSVGIPRSSCTPY